MSVDICATCPMGVLSQILKPGTAALIVPPPAETGGPQQGGFSISSTVLLIVVSFAIKGRV